jgi:hypothetical protein
MKHTSTHAAHTHAAQSQRVDRAITKSLKVYTDKCKQTAEKVRGYILPEDEDFENAAAETEAQQRENSADDMFTDIEDGDNDTILDADCLRVGSY